MTSKIPDFFENSEHVFLMKLYNINEKPPIVNKNSVVPVNDWTFEKYTLIFSAAEVRAAQTWKWRKPFYIVEKLELIFKGVNYVEFLINSDQAKYFLFFVTNQTKQPEIFMNQVVRTRKRKVNMIQMKRLQKLDSFFNLGETQSQVITPPKKIKLPKWRNIYNLTKNYFRRLLGSQDIMRVYCSLD